MTEHGTWRKSSHSNGSNSCVEVGVWRKSSYSANGNACVEVGAWQKSSYSANANSCVEATLLDPTVGVRDSKNPGGPVLVFPAAGWARLLGGDLRDGESPT